MYQLTELAIRLSDSQWEGQSFNCVPVPGDQEVLQVTVSDWSEMPIYVTITDVQILFIVYLFKKEEVKDDQLNELNDRCLQLNIPLPLAAFATIEDQYTLFRALSTRATFENIQEELVTLGENAVEALEALEEYLK